MRLLYAYFDFSVLKEKNGDFRGVGECGLNFSTTHNFFVSKASEVTENGERTIYTVSMKYKPDEEQIPEGFWGERIYNVTAIVGSNGTGKSTLIHNMIKAVVQGLNPGVPFIVLLQETDSNRKIMYCGSPRNEHSFQIKDRCKEFQTPQTIYPEQLKMVKTMLIDNSLSTASKELDEQYSKVVPYWINQDKEGVEPEQLYEDKKQFINKSLFSSIKYSNAMSAANRPTSAMSVDQQLEAHFRYESLQETRFLFDKFQQSKLNTLKEENYPFPTPNYLYVTAYQLEDLHYFFQKETERLDRASPGILKIYKHLESIDFLGVLLADALYSFYVVLCLEFGMVSPLDKYADKIMDGEIATAHPVKFFWISNRDVDNSSKESLAWTILHALTDLLEKQLKDYYEDLDKKTNRKPIREERIEWIKSVSECCRKYVEFILDNSEILKDIFQPYQDTISGNLESERNLFEKRINIKEVLSSERKKNTVIKFLELYRKASCFTYFLVFSSGLSSGEKNMLRMLTQFRYAFDGPSVYPDNVTDENNTTDVLRNIFFIKEQNKFTLSDNILCDSLFLFLDEADLTYHPEWQRQFVSVLTAILSKMFRNPYSEKDKSSGCKDIQVVLATHSPLMLGDFPKASTIYLKRDASTGNITEVTNQNHQSTFGENLYTMLKDSFFMDDSVGEFAKRKINSAAEWCGKVRSLVDRQKGLQRKKSELESGNWKPEQTNNIDAEADIQVLRDRELAALRREQEQLNQEKEALSGMWKCHNETAKLLSPGIIQNKLTNELAICEVLLMGERQKQSRREKLEQEARRLREKLESTEKQLLTLEDGYESNQ